MRKTSIIAGLIIASFSLASCSSGDLAAMEAEKIASFDLTPSQQRVMELSLIGYKKAAGRSMLKSSEIGSLGCYAKTVRMPQRFKKAHEIYLQDYKAVDKDFYGYFAKHGIGEQAAYDMFQIYDKAYERCTLSGMIKKKRAERSQGK